MMAAGSTNPRRMMTHALRWATLFLFGKVTIASTQCGLCTTVGGGVVEGTYTLRFKVRNSLINAVRIRCDASEMLC